MSEQREIAAVILGELIPELEYAAPLLLERLEEGKPLVDRRSPPDLGFETGAIDPRLLELFRNLAPFVNAALSYGLLGLVQSWLMRRSTVKSLGEIQAALVSAQIENEKLRQAFEAMRSRLNGAVGGPVTKAEFDETMAAAVERLVRDR
jgi:hypothetical protein